MRGRLFAIAAVVTGALCLSGCLATLRDDGATPPPTLTAAPQTPVPKPSLNTPPGPQAGDTGLSIDCGGGSVVIDAGTSARSVTGTCTLVQINGADLIVQLGDAIVDRVEVHGDRIRVAGADLGAVAIGGQDNVVDATRLGAVDISGDRNTVDVDGGVGAVTVGGNDNTITADRIGAVVSQGQGNVIRSR